jgi:hypothetical protein
MWRRFLFVAVLSTFALGLAACGGKEASQAETGQPAAMQAGGDTAAARVDTAAAAAPVAPSGQ